MFDQELAWEQVNKYLNLEIGGKKIVCPYFTNHIGKAFLDALHDGGVELETARRVIKNFNERKYPLAWWRGKGTPEQIVEATQEIAKLENVNLEKASAQVVREFMLHQALGVDCSGFVYNVLSFAGINFELEVFKAGASTFAGKSSNIIPFANATSGDLVLIKNKDDIYTHVALILSDENNNLKIIQSTSMSYPIGIFVDNLDIHNEVPQFSFVSELGTDWETLWSEGRLEFRRLAFE